MASQRTEQAVARLAELTPKQIVAELDRYIVGQQKAKRSVAIALRNRWRRQRTPESIRDEISPNNIILIGSTGVGKTEVARRLARLAGAPFVKVEASKFTEVGYVGRDVESMVRDLIESAISMVRTEREQEVEGVARERVVERLLDLLLPPPPSVRAAENPTSTASTSATESKNESKADSRTDANIFTVSSSGDVKLEVDAGETAADRYQRTRDKFRKLLLDGQLDEREVEVEVARNAPAFPEMVTQGGSEGMTGIADWFRDIMPKRLKPRTVKVSEARRILQDEELAKLVDKDDITSDALDRVEKMGIIFLDEIDKIAGERGKGAGPDVSREGVQRDLLPIVEGSNVQTKYGVVKTDHVLFIAAGAFHVSKPGDLIPELQGRFPIRVELDSLTEADFVRIMTEPENSLTKQYSALVAAEGATLEFTSDGVAEIARFAARVNESLENIGARRLHTVMSTLLDDVLFSLPDEGPRVVVIDRDTVRSKLQHIIEDEDLRKYML